MKESLINMANSGVKWLLNGEWLLETATLITR